MEASGLTVGGFYKHFRSKDELLAHAIAQGFIDSGEEMSTALQNVPKAERWKELVRGYLSPGHCDNFDTGCPFAALGPEIARAKLPVRRRVSRLMKERTAQWLAFMPGGTARERERNFFIIFSGMMGAVSVARLFTDPADRRKVLESMRDHLLRSF
jgi:TetR/AcrR family transcriptional repressor of nem operon